MVLNKKYFNIYLVTAIIIIFLIFMLGSMAVVMKGIGGGRTSVDIALKQLKNDCDKKNGTLIRLNKNNRLNTACIVELKKSNDLK